MGLRDIKAQARGDLHQTMQVPAVYAAPGGAQRRCNPRVHSKFDALGDQQGTSFNYAERIEKTPRLVFWRSEIDAELEAHGIIVIVDPITGQPTGEAYRLNTSEPPDLQTVTWLVTVLPAAQIPMLV